ncbi:MAG TPA: argininosuccinate lyase, partial [Acidimicrobiales bacterium]|nr:argininosuccinate lyase [Acidimicrobiales bacterium]
MTLWSGRLSGGRDDEMAAFTSSLGFDKQLWQVDLAGSRAHVTGLRTAGLVSDDEARALIDAIDGVARELEGDTFVFTDSDEDIHTAVERRVTELIGSTGAKLHTGRSRNDQVATDLRLWTRHAIAMLSDAVLDLATTLHESADRAGDAYLPGYTHLQRAQPVLLSHHLRAHAWALLRDADRLFDADVRVDASPLGAGALAGSSLPLDPAVAARELGFSSTFHNSLDAVSDRDFVAELLFCAALCAVHLSRMGEELVLWTSAEFGFCELDDRFTTGSSMLPQKKNPDAAELSRGKAGRLIGNLTGLLATLKGLPLSYNRDLQEDKEPLFDSVAQLRGALLALRGCYATATFKTAAMAVAADDDDAVAVDLAEWLVVRGTPFRDAHHTVGALVALAHERGVRLRDVVAESDSFGDEALSLFEAGSAVR